LETRKLRLSVVAYLRGLLEPYYDNGMKSVIRENMVLKALSTDLSATALESSAFIDASIVSVHKNATGLYDRMYDKINDVKSMREMNKLSAARKATVIDSSGHKKHRGARTPEEMVNLYKVLTETGLLQKMAEGVTRG
jgi:hypothetical protein